MSEFLNHIRSHHIEYRIIGTFLAPILVIIGWIIVNNQNNKREDRKELRKTIDEITSKIEKIEISAIKFHQNKKYNQEEASSILTQYSKITSQISRIRTRTRTKHINCYGSAIKLNESITEENFSANKFTKQPHNSYIIEGISTNSSLLIDELENLFYNSTKSIYVRLQEKIPLKTLKTIITLQLFLLI